MKRYVKEIANDILCKNYPEQEKQKIEKVINLCNKGLITSLEATKMIIDIHYPANDEFQKGYDKGYEDGFADGSNNPE